MEICWLLTWSLILCLPVARAQDSFESNARPEETAQESTSLGQVTRAEFEAARETQSPTTPLATKPWLIPKTVRPTAPDVYLLPDASGKLRQVLGFRYEDFFKAWQRDEGSSVDTPPRYLLDAWNVTGEVSEVHAQLRVEFKITLQAAGWIDIPIQLPRFIVQQFSIEKQEEGECLIFDKQRHGHVVWLSGQAGQQRKLVLEGLTKLKLSTGNHGLELHLPRATTSQFSLHVPASSTRLESSPDLALTTVAPNQEAGQETIEVRLLGQASPLGLNWTPAEADASNQTPLVEAEGETTVYLDRRRVLYTAQLQINSFHSPLKQIHVRLPRGAKLISGEISGDYEFQKVDAMQEVDSAGKRLGQVLLVRRKGPSEGPWELQIQAERLLDFLKNTTECVVDGFEVLDAFRQSGSLTLEIDDQLQAYFDLHGNMDQTPLQKSATTVKGRSILGQFQYSRFPWRLAVFSSPRQRRFSVEPSYHLSFNSESARLDVQYDYQLTGAQIFLLRIDLQGWELTDAPIESGGLINTSGVVETQEGPLVLPVVDSSAQQLRINLSLRKDLQLGKNVFFLPEPLGAFVVDGELLVDATEALQITPNADEMTGLSFLTPTLQATLLTSAPRSEDPDNEPLRLRTFLARPKFVAQVAQRPLQLIVAEQTTVEIDQQSIHVRQQIDYQAKYQPVSQLALSLPEQLRSNDSLTVSLEGELLPIGLDASIDEGLLERLGDPLAEEGMQLRSMIVSLPRPMQNAIPIEIDYELSAPKFVSDESTPLLLPLAVPKDSVSSHEVVIHAAPSVLVTVDQRSAPDVWSVVVEDRATDVSTPTSGATSGARLKAYPRTLREGASGRGFLNNQPVLGRALTLLATEKRSFLSLHAQLNSVGQAQLATLERGWIQSWIAAGRRQQRAVFRFHTAHTSVFAQLPADLGDLEIEVLLDGDPWQYKLLKENRLVVTLPPGGQRQSHTLELRYQQPAALPSWGKLRTSLPRLECHLTSAPIYWQLVLPRGWRVATAPPQLIPDYWLGWKNSRWGRQPTFSQSELEQITSAVQGAAPPPLSTQYVYRAFEIPAEIQVVVVEQVGLLLVGALVAFGVGLLWLYTPLARSGLFWLVLSLVLMLGIFAYPEVTLLATQTILTGGFLTFATGVLRHVFGSVAIASSPPTHTHSSIETTETWQQQTPGQSPASSGTTATLPTGGPSS